MPDFDFHTHRLSLPPGEGIVNLPAAWTEHPEQFRPVPGGCYSAGIHPWWTADAERTERMLRALPRLLHHPQVVRVGECGLDWLRGADRERQTKVFCAQIELAEQLELPVTLHVVKAFDQLLRLKKLLRPSTNWTVHGFRGHAALARQLLDAGIDLSFGEHYQAEAFELTPAARRHTETDDAEEAYSLLPANPTSRA